MLTHAASSVHILFTYFRKCISRKFYSENVRTELNSIVDHFCCIWVKKSWTAVRESQADKHLTKSELWSVKSWTYILLSIECRSPLPIYVRNRTSLLSWKLPGLRNGNWVNCMCVLTHQPHCYNCIWQQRTYKSYIFGIILCYCNPLFPGK